MIYKEWNPNAHTGDGRLPEGLQQALQAHTGLEAFFYSMSRSCQREYLEYISEAQKPETRYRRMAKVVDMVLAQQAKKQEKQNQA